MTLLADTMRNSTTNTERKTNLARLSFDEKKIQMKLIARRYVNE